MGKYKLGVGKVERKRENKCLTEMERKKSEREREKKKRVAKKRLRRFCIPGGKIRKGRK